ncbi:MAG TPA: AraC family transcriptional regulator [Saprospiraceae bacterium]|nr:AraC family transcriptional regulator [Saprospiraceae bacterium]
MKVYPFIIPKTNDESIRIQVDEGIYFYDKLHQHKEIQISYIVKGNGRMFMGDSFRPYKAGDLFVIGSGIPHLFESNRNEKVFSKMISIFFDEEDFWNKDRMIAEINELQYLWEDAKKGLQIKVHIDEEYLFEAINLKKGVDRLIAFYKVVRFLHVKDKLPISPKIFDYKYTEAGGKRMAEIFDFSLKHFRRTITLEEAAKSAKMNKHAFCRYFKARTNKRYFDFISEIRIEEAAVMIRTNPDINISEIAHLCGFNNIAHFNRQFKKIKGRKPLEFRKLR